MEKEQLEHLSIILEVVAFLLVTIDLYGKERLQNLRNRIVGFTSKELFDKFIQTSVASNIFFIATRPFASESSPYNIEKYIASYISLNYPNLIGWKFTLLKFFILLISILIVSMALMLITYCIIRILVFISGRFSYEGVMIVIGAVLFIIAKTLGYIAVGL